MGKNIHIYPQRLSKRSNRRKRLQNFLHMVQNTFKITQIIPPLLALQGGAGLTTPCMVGFPPDLTLLERGP